MIIAGKTKVSLEAQRSRCGDKYCGLLKDVIKITHLITCPMRFETVTISTANETGIAG